MLECTAVYGNEDLFEDDPSVFAATNAIYIPVSDPSWGVFDTGRRPILTSCYYNGPQPVIHRGITEHRHADISDEFVLPCLYIGNLHQHFGHFVLSTISRLWPLIRLDDPAPRTIVCHSAIPVAQFFNERPWASDMIRGLGLTPANFVCFERATKIKQMIVPAPSFEETNYGHLIFAELCHTIGSNLTQCHQEAISARPAYLSKERLRSGVRKIANEKDAVELLKAEGVDIIYPETMSFIEQVSLWRDRPVVASFVASSLHASAFAPGRRIVAHSDSMVISSSFTLIDKLNGARATYLGMPEGGIVGRTQTPEFTELSYIADPRAYANAILEAVYS